MAAWIYMYNLSLVETFSTSVVYRARPLYCSVRLRMESLSKLVAWAPQSTLVSNPFTRCVYTPPPPPLYGQYQFFFVFTVHIVLGVVKSSVSPMEYVVCMYIHVYGPGQVCIMGVLHVPQHVIDIVVVS